MCSTRSLRIDRNDGVTGKGGVRWSGNVQSHWLGHIHFLMGRSRGRQVGRSKPLDFSCPSGQGLLGAASFCSGGALLASSDCQTIDHTSKVQCGRAVQSQCLDCSRVIGSESMVSILLVLKSQKSNILPVHLSPVELDTGWERGP